MLSVPLTWLERAGGMAVLTGRVFVELFTPGLSWRREFFIQCMFVFKVAIIPAIVVLTAFGFSGSGIVTTSLLASLGTSDRAGAIVPIAFMREFGGWFVASVVAGTAGTTITAEIGARKIREELDALRVLGVDVTRNMVLPRVLALTLLTPVVHLIAFFGGTAGTFLCSGPLFGDTLGAFIPEFLSNTSYHDLWQSSLKLAILGFVIGVICSYKGLNVKGGAQGVGRAVNEAVVACLLSIFLISLVFTQFFLVIFPEVSVYR